MVYSRRNKYGNKKQTADGYTFDSKAELLRYDELQLMEKAGRIYNLVVHPEFFVVIKGIQVCKVMLDGPLGRVFRVARDGSWVDVRWLVNRLDERVPGWSKRMKPDALQMAVEEDER